MFDSKEDAYDFLRSISAPQHLITHVTLVGEAAELLIAKFNELDLELDYGFIRTGVAIHDVGKVIHQNEMSEGGGLHEPEGEKMLIANGWPPKLARVCISHARWNEMDCSLEELIIALSDKLWKGKRVEELEIMVIDQIASVLNTGRWDIFADLDQCFEDIASSGHTRLQRSVSS